MLKLFGKNAVFCIFINRFIVIDSNLKKKQINSCYQQEIDEQ